MALAYAAIGVVVTLLPLHLRHALGASDTVVGIVMGAQAMIAVVTRPFAAAAGERRGYRVVLALGGFCLLAADAGYLVSHSVHALGAVRMATGFGEACVFTAAGAWVLALAPAERRGRSLAQFGLSLWGGYTVGPIIGEALARGAGGLRSAALGGVVLAAASAACALSLADVRTRSSVPERVPLFPSAVLYPGATFTLSAFGYAALGTFAALHFTANGWGGAARPLVAFGAAFMLTRWLGAGLPDRLGSVPVAVGGALVEACGLLTFALAATPWLALAGAMVIGAGFALMYPALALLAVNAVPPSHRGATLGAFTSFWDFSLAIGAPVAGALTTWGGGRAPFLGGAACALGAAGLALLRGPLAAPTPEPIAESGD